MRCYGFDESLVEGPCVVTGRAAPAPDSGPYRSAQMLVRGPGVVVRGGLEDAPRWANGLGAAALGRAAIITWTLAAAPIAAAAWLLG